MYNFSSTRPLQMAQIFGDDFALISWFVRLLGAFPAVAMMGCLGVK